MQSKVDSYQDDGTTRWSKEESRDEVPLSPSHHLHESRGRDSS